MAGFDLFPWLLFLLIHHVHEISVFMNSSELKIITDVVKK